MNTLKLTAAVMVASIVALTSPAFAQRTSTYPEGSIHMQPSTQAPLAAKKAPQSAKLSPLNPLDAPQAGNVWKPSNRDAGNLTAQRWQDYQDKVNTLPADVQ
jgi:hypothetical protein